MSLTRHAGFAACLALLLAATSAHGAPGWGAPDSPGTPSSPATSAWASAGATVSVMQQCANTNGFQIYLNGACYPLAGFNDLGGPPSLGKSVVYFFFASPVPEAANGAAQPARASGGSVNLQVRKWQNGTCTTQIAFGGLSFVPPTGAHFAPPPATPPGQTLWTMYTGVNEAEGHCTPT